MKTWTGVMETKTFIDAEHNFFPILPPKPQLDGWMVDFQELLRCQINHSSLKKEDF